MDARRRRFLEAVEREVERRRQGAAAGARFVAQVLRLLQADVRDVLERLPSEFDAVFLPELEREVARKIDRWEAREAAPVVEAVLEEAAELAPLLVDGPLASAGIRLEVGRVAITDSLLASIAEVTSEAVAGIGDAARAAIDQHVALGVLGGQSPHEVMVAIGEQLDGPGPFRLVKFRAETIMRTQTGIIHSVEADKRLRAAAEEIPDLGSEWLWSGKSRAAHQAVNGHKRKVGVPFLVGGEEMLYPRQPGKSAANVINCGCNAVPWLARWES